ncbi:hypothetical protein [Solimonas sp. K1W22B-7]|nr:hypothetical protein [Solimonas sp. K1W22B-7]
MSIKYYDYGYGRERYKRRYVWAIQAYGFGLLSGLILISVLG